MENNNKVDLNTATFLKNALVSQSASIKNFEDQVPTLKFDGENALAWQFIVLKSFEVEYSYLMPLANHLLDHNYCIVDKNMAKFAALNGYQLEVGLNNLKNVQDQLNGHMSDFFFDEKLIITNEPAQNIYNLAKKIISRTSEENYKEVQEVFQKAGIDSNSIKLMHRPQVKSVLKM